MKDMNNLRFLQHRIQEIGSALFYSLSSAVLKFPTTIVNTLKVDETGNIWFFINRPEQNLTEFDWEFPAKMQFYRKGKSYFLQIAGKACIVNDPEEVNSLQGLPEETRTKAFHDMVLIKLKINVVQYHEYYEAQPKLGIWQKIYNWLFAPTVPSMSFTLQPSHA
jgi:general stress protein 26